MAGETEVQGIALGLGLDVSPWSSGIAHARSEWEAFRADVAKGVNVQGPSSKALTQIASPVISPRFQVSAGSVRQMRVAINQEMRQLAQAGEGVAIPIRLGRVPFGAMRAQIAQGIGEVPITVRVANVVGRNDVLTAVIAQGTGSTMGAARQSIEHAAASKGIPKRAQGGPTTWGRPYVVGENGPEIHWPRQSGYITPHAMAGRAVSFPGVRENLAANLRRATPEQVKFGLNWYPSEGKRLAEAAAQRGMTPAALAAIVAKFSQNSPWPQNLHYATRFIDQMHSGLTPETVKGIFATMSARRDAAEVIFGRMSPTGILRGPKETPFAHALLGDPRAVPVDRWMNRAAGYGLTSSGKPRNVAAPGLRDAITEATLSLADERGWMGSGAQAVIWDVIGGGRDPKTGLRRARGGMVGRLPHAAAGIFASAMRPDLGHPTTVAGAQRIFNREPRLQFLERSLPDILGQHGYPIDKVTPLFGGYMGDIERSAHLKADLSLPKLRQLAALTGRLGLSPSGQQESTILSVVGKQALEQRGLTPNASFFVGAAKANTLRDVEAIRKKIAASGLAAGFSLTAPEDGVSKLMFSLRQHEMDALGGETATMARMKELGSSIGVGIRRRPGYMETFERTVGAAPWMMPTASYGQVGRGAGAMFSEAQRAIHSRILRNPGQLRLPGFSDGGPAFSHQPFGFGFRQPWKVSEDFAKYANQIANDPYETALAFDPHSGKGTGMWLGDETGVRGIPSSQMRGKISLHNHPLQSYPAGALNAKPYSIVRPSTTDVFSALTTGEQESWVVAPSGHSIIRPSTRWSEFGRPGERPTRETIVRQLKEYSPHHELRNWEHEADNNVWDKFYAELGDKLGFSYERYGRAGGGPVEFNLEGMRRDLQPRVEGTVGRLLRTYPMVGGSSLTKVQMTRRLGAMAMMPYGAYESFPDEGTPGTIHMAAASSAAGVRDYYSSTGAMRRDKGFHFPGTSSIEGNVTHEFGHAVRRYVEQNKLLVPEAYDKLAKLEDLLKTDPSRLRFGEPGYDGFHGISPYAEQWREMPSFMGGGAFEPFAELFSALHTPGAQTERAPKPLQGKMQSMLASLRYGRAQGGPAHRGGLPRGYAVDFMIPEPGEQLPWHSLAGLNTSALRGLAKLDKGPDIQLPAMLAIARKGQNVVGSAPFTFDYNEGGWHPVMTHVDLEHRRKGLATAMYSKLERFTGKPVLPSDTQTSWGRALWQQGNRAFGRPFLPRHVLTPFDQEMLAEYERLNAMGVRTEGVGDVFRNAGASARDRIRGAGDEDDVVTGPLRRSARWANGALQLRSSGPWVSSQLHRAAGGGVEAIAALLRETSPWQDPDARRMGMSEHGYDFDQMTNRYFTDNRSTLRDALRDTRRVAPWTMKHWSKQAEGGDVPPGTYIVNEIGRELFVPRTAEHKIPPEVAAQIPGGGLLARRLAREQVEAEPWKPAWMRRGLAKDITGQGRAAGGMIEIPGSGPTVWQAPEDGWIIPNRLMGKVPRREDGGGARGAGATFEGDPGPDFFRDAQGRKRRARGRPGGGQYAKSGSSFDHDAFDRASASTSAFNKRLNEFSSGLYSSTPDEATNFVPDQEGRRFPKLGVRSTKMFVGGLSNIFSARNTQPSEQTLAESEAFLKPFQRVLPRGTDLLEHWAEQVEVANKFVGESAKRFSEASPQYEKATKAFAHAKTTFADLTHATEEGARARKDLAIKPSDYARQFIGLVASFSAYGVAVQGVTEVLKIGATTAKPFLDRITGFSVVASDTTERLAKASRELGGNIPAVIARAAPGVGASGQAYLAGAGPAITARAGAGSAQDILSMFQTALALNTRKSVPGVYSGTGGVLGGPILAEQLGGQIGVGEVLGRGVTDFQNAYKRGVTDNVPWVGTAPMVGSNGLPVSGEFNESGMPAGGAKQQSEALRGLNEWTTAWNEAGDRAVKIGGAQATGLKLVSAQMAGIDPKQFDKLPDFAKFGDYLNGTGLVLVDAANKVTNDFNKAQQTLLNAGQGYQIEDLAAFSARTGRELQGARKTSAFQGQFERGTQIPGQFALDLLANPFAPAATGFKFADDAEAKKFQTTVSGITASQKALTDQANAALDQQRAFVKSWVPELSGQFETALGDIGKYGAEITRLNASSADAQAALATANYNNNKRILERSKKDAASLLSGKGSTSASGDNLGAIQRAQFDVGRQSQSLGFELTQRQINFQTAIAGFQAPGITGQERAARITEAQIEAKYAQQQLNLQKQQFTLEGTAFTITARRANIDAKYALDLEKQARDTQLIYLGTTKNIATNQLALSQAQAKATSIINQAASNQNAVLGVVDAQLKVFGGTVESAMNQIRQSMGLSTEYTYRNSAGKIVTTTSDDIANKHAAGAFGLTSPGGHVAMYGEAGTEGVVAIKSPRLTDASAMFGGGGMVPGGGGIHIGQIIVTGNDIKSDMDLDHLASVLADKVETRLGQEGKLRGISLH